MSATVAAAILAKVTGEKQPVNAKKAATDHSVTIDVARAAFDEVYSANKDNMSAVYLVTGIASDFQVKVQLVPAASLEAHCSTLSRVISRSIFALYPTASAETTPSDAAAALSSAYAQSSHQERVQYRTKDMMVANPLRTNSLSRVQTADITRSRGAFALPAALASPIADVSNAFAPVSGSTLAGPLKKQMSIADAFRSASSSATQTAASPTSASAASSAATPAQPLSRTASVGGLRGMFASASISSASATTASVSGPSVAKPASEGGNEGGFKLGDDPFADSAPTRKPSYTMTSSTSSSRKPAARKPAAVAGKAKGGRKGLDKAGNVAGLVASGSDDDSNSSGSESDTGSSLARRFAPASSAAAADGEESDDGDAFVARPGAAGGSVRRATAVDSDSDAGDGVDERAIRAAKQAEARKREIAAAEADADGFDKDDDDGRAPLTGAAAAAAAVGRKGRRSMFADESDDDEDDVAAEVARQFAEEQALARQEKAAAAADARAQTSLAQFLGGKKKKVVEKEVTFMNEHGFLETRVEQEEVTDDEAPAASPATATAAAAGAETGAGGGESKRAAGRGDAAGKGKGKAMKDEEDEPAAKRKTKEKVLTKSIFSFFKKE